jgi:hypothetical protein
MHDRPQFFVSLLTQIVDLRARTARPHWLIIDEAHHMLPSSWVPANSTVPEAMTGMIMITVHPEAVSPAALKNVQVAVAVGKAPRETLAGFARAVGEAPPRVGARDLENGEIMVWCRGDRQQPFLAKSAPAKVERRRHLRKYAEGDLGADRSFYFRGPEGKLNLRAQNLQMFATMAEGVDDETWLYHLRRGEYSNWFRTMIKDESLATEVAETEADDKLSAADSRERIKAAIETRYTAAA